MRRGTTPTLKFTTPYVADMIVDGYITFVQRGVIVLDKKLTDENVIVEDRNISLELTQEDTLNFADSSRAKVQIRLILKDEKAVASSVVEIPIGEILKEGVI